MRKSLIFLSSICVVTFIFGCISSSTEEYEIKFYDNEAWAYNNSFNNVTTIIRFVGIAEHNEISCYIFETHKAAGLTSETISNSTLYSKTFYVVDDSSLSIVREEFYESG